MDQVFVEVLLSDPLTTCLFVIDLILFILLLSRLFSRHLNDDFLLLGCLGCLFFLPVVALLLFALLRTLRLPVLADRAPLVIGVNRCLALGLARCIVTIRRVALLIAIVCKFVKFALVICVEVLGAELSEWVRLRPHAV